LAARLSIVRKGAESSTYYPRAPAARLGGQSELGAAALLNTVWWGMRLASLLAHLFLFFPDINTSQGSVATRLRYGEIFYYRITRNLLLSLSMKEFWKSVST